jgi:hypothetical protein
MVRAVLGTVDAAVRWTPHGPRRVVPHNVSQGGTGFVTLGIGEQRPCERGNGTFSNWRPSQNRRAPTADGQFT